MSLDPGSQFTMQLIQSLGSQISEGIAQGREQQALRPFLDQLKQSQDPEEILNQILQIQASEDIMPETKKSIGQIAGPISQSIRSRETADLRRLEIQRKTTEAKEKKEEKLKEKLNPLKQSLSTIQAMRDVRANNNLGVTTGAKAIFSGAVRKDRESWLTNARTLIGLANTPGLSIRNREEFNAIAGSLLDTNISDEAAEGLLDQLERKLTEAIGDLTGEKQEEQQPARNLTSQDAQVTLEEIRAERERRKGPR